MTSLDFSGYDPKTVYEDSRSARARILYDAYKTTLNNPYSAPDTPQARTQRQLRNYYDQVPLADVGFLSKFYNAIAEETGTGQALSNLFDPSFAKTDYVFQQEDFDYFASDLPKEVVERIASKSQSLEQFLFETDEARTTIRRRKEIFNDSPIAGGAAVLIAAGGEAAIYTGLVTALTGGIGTGGAVASSAIRYRRMKGVLSGLSLVAAVDTPIELVRYQSDNTMTVQDLLISLGTAAGFGGAIGGAFPQVFQNLKRASETTAVRQAVQAAGSNKEAQKILDVLNPKVSIEKLTDDDIVEEVLRMSPRELAAEARRLGIDLEADPVLNQVGPPAPRDFPQLQGPNLGVVRVSDPDFVGPRNLEGPNLNAVRVDDPDFVGPRRQIPDDPDDLIDPDDLTEIPFAPRQDVDPDFVGPLDLISPTKRSTARPGDPEFVGPSQFVGPPIKSQSLFEEAVLSSNKASVAFLRKKFNLTRTQAEKVLDKMEKAGLVTAKNKKGGRRKVLPKKTREAKDSVESNRDQIIDQALGKEVDSDVQNLRNSLEKAVEDGEKLKLENEEALNSLFLISEKKFFAAETDEEFKLWQRSRDGRMLEDKIQKLEEAIEEIDFNLKFAGEELKRFNRDPKKFLRRLSEEDKQLAEIRERSLEIKKERRQKQRNLPRKDGAGGEAPQVGDSDFVGPVDIELEKSIKAAREKRDKSIQAKILADEKELQKIRKAQRERGGASEGEMKAFESEYNKLEAELVKPFAVGSKQRNNGQIILNLWAIRNNPRGKRAAFRAVAPGDPNFIGPADFIGPVKMSLSKVSSGIDPAIAGLANISKKIDKEVLDKIKSRGAQRKEKLDQLKKRREYLNSESVKRKRRLRYLLDKNRERLRKAQERSLQKKTAEKQERQIRDRLLKKVIDKKKSLLEEYRKRTAAVSVSKADKAVPDDSQTDTFPNSNIKKSEVTNPDEIDSLNQRPLSEEPESAIVSDTGERLSEGPFLSVNAEELAEDAGPRTIFGHGEGGRETAARLIDETGAPPVTIRGDEMLPIKMLKKIGVGFYKVFTPTFFRMQRSKSPFVRKIGKGLMTSPRGGGPASARSVADANFEIIQTALAKKMDEAAEIAAKEGKKLDEQLVVHVVRGGSGGGAAEKYAAEAVRKYYKQLFDHAKKAGVFVDGVASIANYFPRRWSSNKFQIAIEKLGQGNREEGKKKLVEFFTESALSHSKSKKFKLTRSDAKKTAERIVSYGSNPQSHRDWNSTIESINRLKKTLAKEMEESRAAGGVAAKTDYGVDDILELIIPHVDHKSHISHGKHRLGLDETFAMDFDGIGTVRFADLTDNSLTNINRQYARQIIGGAEARNMLAAITDDVSEIDGLSALKSRVYEDSLQAGDSVKDAEFFAGQVELHFKMLTGQKLYRNEVVKAGTFLNMLSMGTMGMTLGLAQIPEIANIFLRTSFSAALNQLSPREALDIFTMGLKGKTTKANKFASSIETFTGIGGDLNRGDHFMRRMDDLAIDDDFLQTMLGRALDNGRLFASLNPLGIMPMDTFLRRWAARASFQHFVDTAYKSGPKGKITLNKSWWNNSKVRFGELGMNEEDINRLTKILRNTDNVQTSQGLFGPYKVNNFDFSKVEDKYIIDKFILALRRHTDSMIQRQTAGELPAWMNEGLFKIFTQFRVFTVAAKSKQLAAGIARGDAKEAVNVVGSSALAMLGYATITYYRSLGQEDPMAYWTEKTQEEKLMKSAILRSGYSTIIPMLTDILAFHADGEGVFDASMRTTGLGIDPLSGSTAHKNVYTAFGSLSAMAKSLRADYDFRQQDARDVASLIWLTKIPLVNQVIEKMISRNLPESNR